MTLSVMLDLFLGGIGLLIMWACVCRNASDNLTAVVAVVALLFYACVLTIVIAHA